MTDKRVLALDFDGVIADSRDECFVMAVNAYRHVRPDSETFPKEFSPGNEQELLYGVYAGLLDRYKTIRPYVVDAFSFFVLLHALEEGVTLRSQDDYFVHREKVSDFHDRFVKAFYDARSAWMREDFADWRALIKPYPLLAQFPKLAKQFHIVVCTNNDREPVQAFLDDHKARVDHIFDNTYGSDKREHLKAISKHFSLPLTDLFFVDDNLHHLQAARKLGVNSFLSGWGYHTEKQAEQARRESIGVLQRKDASRILLTCARKSNS